MRLLYLSLCTGRTGRPIQDLSTGDIHGYTLAMTSGIELLSPNYTHKFRFVMDLLQNMLDNKGTTNLHQAVQRVHKSRKHTPSPKRYNAVASIGLLDLASSFWPTVRSSFGTLCRLSVICRL